MYFSMLITQGVVPVGLLLWQGWSRWRSPSKGRSHNRLGWLLKTLLVAVYLSAVSLTGIWPVLLAWWTPYLYWAIWLLLAALTYRHDRNLARWPKRTFWGISKIILCGGLVGCFTVYQWRDAPPLNGAE